MSRGNSPPDSPRSSRRAAPLPRAGRTAVGARRDASTARGFRFVLTAPASVPAPPRHSAGDVAVAARAGCAISSCSRRETGSGAHLAGLPVSITLVRAAANRLTPPPPDRATPALPGPASHQRPPRRCAHPARRRSVVREGSGYRPGVPIFTGASVESAKQARCFVLGGLSARTR